MKKIILSADNSFKLYSVPDLVALNLIDYVCDFDDWLKTSEEMKDRREVNEFGDIGVSFDETDFIRYLNKHRFKNEQSTLIKDLSIYEIEEIPKEYINLPKYFF